MFLPMTTRERLKMLWQMLWMPATRPHYPNPDLIKDARLAYLIFDRYNYKVVDAASAWRRLMARPISDETYLDLVHTYEKRLEYVDSSPRQWRVI